MEFTVPAVVIVCGVILLALIVAVASLAGEVRITERQIEGWIKKAGNLESQLELERSNRRHDAMLLSFACSERDKAMKQLADIRQALNPAQDGDEE